MIQRKEKIIKLSAIIVPLVFILTTNLSRAWEIFFSDYYIQDLKVVEVDIESETAIFQSPDGETATLTAGDVIGQGAFTVSSIHKKTVELESAPDNRGKTWKSRMVVNQEKLLEDCKFIESKKLKQ